MAATKAQIAHWKQTHGEIYQFTTKKEGKTIYGYFKAPSGDTILAMSEFIESDTPKAINILYQNTKIFVDPQGENDDAVKYAFIAQIKSLWKNYSVTVKKL